MRLSSGRFLCACLACLSLLGCSEEKTAEPSAPRPARIATVSPKNLGLVAQGAGRIQARYVSPVGFEVSGRLISRDVSIGDMVKKGQKLAELSADDYQNKVTAAQAAVAATKAVLAQAAAEENRKRILLGKGFAPRAMYDAALRSLRSAEAEVKATEANLQIAQNQLNYTQLLAPDDGVVTASGADPGQVVSAGQMVVEVSRNAEHEAVFAVSADHVAHAKIGMSIQVWLQGKPEVATAGTIREISPEADSSTGTYEVRVSLPSAPPEMRLGAVVVGRVEFEGQQAISLPSTALLQSGDQPQVWVIGNDGEVHRRTVELLEFNTDSVAVSRGISPGEKVVIAGVNSLSEGQQVNPEAEVE
ncbi:triclosan efflux RND transporter adaptor protein TriB [soil metagenome]